MLIGNKKFNIGERTYIMGILNTTPDSFSDGGSFNTIETALERVGQMIEDGVDIIDVGGESTRPGHVIVETKEEIDRVVPIIEAIKAKYDIPISIDTYKGEVAEAAIKAGANLINDIYGFKKCSYISKVAAKYDVVCCLMHNRENSIYEKDIIKTMVDDIKASIEIAINAGVKKKNIILDPGIGFAKTLEDNLLVMNKLEEFKVDNYPILLGTSRKSMIGLTLDLPVNERVEGTIATTVLGVAKGIDFIRVHDIKQNKRATQMVDAMVRI
ncbi:MAG: dihydropteroate synthase [Sarcina sp.]